LRPPDLCDRRITGDSELGDVAGHDAKEPRVVEVSSASKIVKAIRANRPPGANRLDREYARRRLDANERRVRRARLPERGRRIEERGSVRGVLVVDVPRMKAGDGGE